MLFSPVYIEAHPRRSAAFASRMNLRDAAHGDSPSSLKSFNSFAINGFQTLLRNGRPQPLYFQTLPDSFHCNGGVYPLSPRACPQLLKKRRPAIHLPHMKSSPVCTILVQCKSFRNNTCENVSKQATLTPFRMNTYEKHRGRGVLLLTRFPMTTRREMTP
jgi:hypothetical protein